ncbi:hypothetical protein AAFF_G00056340 [Aldrovandia affinis]|uniref:Uncharacterized protein n=1 Tax=Aldrovandia affinis TaxID=143900 RepID=A0AAD7S106_9TELE|nr:hypothetical protein AAFF_G00056340 [Aldrovandia affinis]
MRDGRAGITAPRGITSISTGAVSQGILERSREGVKAASSVKDSRFLGQFRALTPERSWAEDSVLVTAAVPPTHAEHAVPPNRKHSSKGGDRTQRGERCHERTQRGAGAEEDEPPLDGDQAPPRILRARASRARWLCRVLLTKSLKRLISLQFRPRQISPASLGSSRTRAAAPPTDAAEGRGGKKSTPARTPRESPGNNMAARWVPLAGKMVFCLQLER